MSSPQVRTTGASERTEAAILLVVDDEAERHTVREMLTPLGHDVVEAASGPAALRALIRQSFAVILLDVDMPEMDGYEAAKLIRRRGGAELTPIIFLTAFGRDKSETAVAYASGPVDFVFAPLLAGVLRAKVSGFVDLFLQSQALQRSVASVSALNVALRDSEARARAVLQNVADGIVTADEDGVIESFNGSSRRLFGYREDEVVGKPLGMLVAPGYNDELFAPGHASWPAAKDLPVASLETVGCRKDGWCFPMEMAMSRTQIGERSLNIACLRDISGRKAYTDALEHRTLHDELTGLPNRVLFGDRMDRAMAAADRDGGTTAVLLVDIDDFREVNDALGPERSDEVIRAVADRLRGAVRDPDTLARLGGDEFGILPAGSADVGTAAGIAWKVSDAFDQPFVVGGDVVDIRASIGIAFSPRHGRTTADLLRRVALATRDAKASGSGVAVFVAEPEDQTQRQLTLLSDLRDGIPRGELVLHYQPKVSLGPEPRTTGVEALVRWRHPREGFLSPDQFMPEVERSELIDPLTSWVLNEALRQQRAWLDRGIELTMAVNISARSLTRGRDLPETVAALTETWGIDPAMLILEITEAAMIDADVPDALRLLNAMGERLAIDDFGTGHSSLAYLQRLPIDEIKVDRSFVMQLASVAGDAVIVRSTVDLAHNLGMTVVAEGVEDEASRDMLIEYGCDGAQGYLFSRPCPADELTAWLVSSPLGAHVAGRAAV